MKKVLKTIPFTPKKYREMQQKVVELEKLRKEVMERLITARGMGDLSENGAYKYAKFELGNVGRQLRKFRDLLAKGFPAPKNTGSKGKIDFGSEVTIEKVGNKKMKKTFVVVSEHESDPAKGKLAYSSPMGKAVMRKKVGDRAKVKTPKGESEWTITVVK